MQLKSNEPCFYMKKDMIISHKDGNNRTYYYVNIADETGEQLTFFLTEDIYRQLERDRLTFGSGIYPILEATNGRNGVRLSLRGYEKTGTKKAQQTLDEFMESLDG